MIVHFHRWASLAVLLIARHCKIKFFVCDQSCDFLNFIQTFVALLADRIYTATASKHYPNKLVSV